MESAAEWFSVVRALYLDQLQLPTVSLMIPVYAPASDHNNPATMIDGIRQLVQCWRGQVAACPTDPPGIASLVAAH